MEKDIKLVNIRSVHFRTIHSDGIIITESPSNQDLLHLYFFTDRHLIPDQIVYSQDTNEDVVNENQQIEVTREYEVAIKIDVETAKQLLQDLDEFLKSI